MRPATRLSATVALLLAATSAYSANALAETAFQERQCIARGWNDVRLNVGGLDRRILWKASQSQWTKGALLVLHGGGGRHFNYCVANVGFIEPQVRFTERALEAGFAVFLLDSTDRVADNEGRPCGKAWDDEVRSRPNLDLPFIREVIGTLIPGLRPSGSRREIFMTGLSSGGYMTARAATHFDDRISAFALVSSGDPYGWFRFCEKGLTQRINVHGVGYDSETRKTISERDACVASTYPNEKSWETASPARKPTFRLLHHENDGIHDISCGMKVRGQLLAHGYPESVPLILRGGSRNFANHLWQDAYNEPLLEFLISQLR
jgi:poly(3-hydroxybutyrate) depolymerase